MKVLWSWELLKSLSSFSLNIGIVSEGTSHQQLLSSGALIISQKNPRQNTNDLSRDATHFLTLIVTVSSPNQVVIHDQTIHIPLPFKTLEKFLLNWSSTSSFHMINDQHYTFVLENSTQTQLQMKFSIETNDILPAFSVSENPPKFQSQHFRSLTCRFCDQPLTDPTCSTELKIRSLPSPYWRELADMWICGCCESHANPHTSEKDSAKQLMVSHVRAKSGFILVGSNHFLVHLSDLRQSQWVVKDVKKVEAERAWRHVNCGRCGSLLGKVEENQNEKDDEDFNYYLFKKSLSTLDHLFEPFTVETECAELISTLSENEGCSRFLIYGEDSNLPRIQLILMPTDNLFHCSSFEDFSHTLQLCFQSIHSLLETDSPSPLTFWKEKNLKYETIALPDEECFVVLGRLELTSRTLDRIINGMKVGFLRKNNFSED